MADALTTGALVALGTEGLAWLAGAVAAGAVKAGAASMSGPVGARIEGWKKVRTVEQSGYEGRRVPDRTMRKWLRDPEVEKLLTQPTAGPDGVDPAVAEALVDRMISLWDIGPSGAADVRGLADEAVAGLLMSLAAENFPAEVKGWLERILRNGEHQRQLLDAVLTGIEEIDLSKIVTTAEFEDMNHDVVVRLDKLAELMKFICTQEGRDQGETSAQFTSIRETLQILVDETIRIRADLASPVAPDPAQSGTSFADVPSEVPKRVRQQIEADFDSELSHRPLTTWSIDELVDRAEELLAENSVVLADLLTRAAIALDADRFIASRAGPHDIDLHFVTAWKEERPDRSDYLCDPYDLFYLAAKFRPVGRRRDNSSVVRCMIRLLRLLKLPVDDDIYRWAERWEIGRQGVARAIEAVDTSNHRLVIRLSHHGGWDTRGASAAEHLAIDQPATSAVGWLIRDGQVVGKTEPKKIDSPASASSVIADICDQNIGFGPQAIDVLLQLRELLQIDPANIEVQANRQATRPLSSRHLVIVHSWDRLSDERAVASMLLSPGRFDDQPPCPAWIQPDDDLIEDAVDEQRYLNQLFSEIEDCGPAVGLKKLPSRSRTWSVILCAAPYVVWHRADGLTDDQRQAIDGAWAEFPGLAGAPTGHDAFQPGEVGVVWDSPEFVAMLHDLQLIDGTSGPASPR